MVGSIRTTVADNADFIRTLAQKGIAKSNSCCWVIHMIQSIHPEPSTDGKRRFEQPERFDVRLRPNEGV